MRLLKQPNHWSCLPTAIAMAIGRTTQEVILAVGHDGSEIIWPDLPEPSNHRSFHLQEFYPIIMANGFVPVIFETKLILANQPGQAFIELGEAISEGSDRGELQKRYDKLAGRLLEVDQMLIINQYMTKMSGVLLGSGRAGTPHAVAWNAVEQLVYDPNGTISKREYFTIEKYLMLTRC